MGMSSVACSVGFASLQSQLFVPLHLCIDSHLCRCIVQRLCVAVFMHPCITALCGCHYASLHSGFVWLSLCVLAWTLGGSPTLSPGMDAGRVCPNALCKDAYKWSNKVGAGRTGNKRPRLHRCRANKAYTALHHGEGVWGFGKDAEIERPKALCKDAYKWSNKVGMQGCIKSVTLNRCTMQRHKRLTRQ